jgi:hypothetical protein
MTASPDSRHPVVAVALPAESRITRFYPAPFLADAFAIQLPPGASTDPAVLARFIFSHQAPWVGRLMRVRDLLVSLFGLKTSKHLAAAGQQRIGIFKIYQTDAQEIILGENDRHLDFRLSLLRRHDGGHAPQLVLSTVVHCHNLLGRSYIRLIAPFHRMVVRSSLRRSAGIGWPAA